MKKNPERYLFTKIQAHQMAKTSLGIDENVEALLSYLLGWITGIIFLLIEKESRFVRFHAMQSVVVFLSITVLQLLLSFLPFLGGIFSSLLGILAFILWIVLMIKAYQGEYYKVPIAGDLAESYL